MGRGNFEGLGGETTFGDGNRTEKSEPVMQPINMVLHGLTRDYADVTGEASPLVDYAVVSEKYKIDGQWFQLIGHAPAAAGYIPPE